MTRKKGRKRLDISGAEGPLTSSPFLDLGKLNDSVATGDSPSPPKPADSAEVESAASSAPRHAVVRFQRKGRGGKEVTLVERLELDPDALDTWLTALKRSLGCGGAREGAALVLQGDQRERLPELLRRLGVARVTTC